MRDGRNKGARYMLHVSRVLSTWVAGTGPKAEAKDLVFRPRSTALMPVEGHWEAKGDLVCRPGLVWPFSVECKCVEDGKLDSILESPKWPVWAWWQQANAQANVNALVPLLVFSRNNRADYAMLTAETADGLMLIPVHGPLLRVECSDRCDVVVICLLADLVDVPKVRLRRL